MVITQKEIHKEKAVGEATNTTDYIPQEMKTDPFFRLLSISTAWILQCHPAPDCAPAFSPAEASLAICINPRSPKDGQILEPGRPSYRLQTTLKFIQDWSEVKWTGQEEEAGLRLNREETENDSKPQEC